MSFDDEDEPPRLVLMNGRGGRSTSLAVMIGSTRVLELRSPKPVNREEVLELIQGCER